MDYEIIEYHGQPARKYPDGSIRNERGHWLEAHPAGHTISQADASQLNHKRYADAQAAIQERILAQMRTFAPDPVHTPTEAYAEIVTKQAIALYDSDKPRFEDVATLGQIMGYVPRKGERTDEQQEPAQQTNITVLIAQYIAAQGDAVPMRNEIGIDSE